MKKQFKRILSIAMALMLMLTVASTAFALTIDIDGMNGDFGGSDLSTNKITFVGGDGYDMTAKTGTVKQANGDVVLNTSANTIDKKLIPDVTSNDPSKTLVGWAIMDKDGNLVPIDILKYQFLEPTKVYPIFAAAGDVASCPKDYTCPIAAFKDSKTNDWYHNGVHFVLEKGLMSGTSTTEFEPETPTSRAMIVAILWRLEGKPEAGEPAFSDVPAGKYYTEAVAWANENKIVSGYPDGTFLPDNNISREQMALIFFNYCAYKGIDVSARADLSKFVDNAKIDDYAKEAIAWANAEGLINGKGAGVLDPLGNATRAEVATILYNFCTKFGA